MVLDEGRTAFLSFVEERRTKKNLCCEERRGNNMLLATGPERNGWKEEGISKGNMFNKQPNMNCTKMYNLHIKSK